MCGMFLLQVVSDVIRRMNECRPNVMDSHMRKKVVCLSYSKTRPQEKGSRSRTRCVQGRRKEIVKLQASGEKQMHSHL